jgi:hypothetical protein
MLERRPSTSECAADDVLTARIETIVSVLYDVHARH